MATECFIFPSREGKAPVAMIGEIIGWALGADINDESLIDPDSVQMVPLITGERATYERDSGGWVCEHGHFCIPETQEMLNERAKELGIEGF